MKKAEVMLGPKPGLVEMVLAREKEHSTWLGHGAAMPHARTNLVQQLCLVVAKAPGGVQWGGQRAELIFLVLVPPHATTDYLGLVRRIGLAMRDDDTRRRLIAAASDEALAAAWRGTA